VLNHTSQLKTQRKTKQTKTKKKCHSHGYLECLSEHDLGLIWEHDALGAFWRVDVEPHCGDAVDGRGLGRPVTRLQWSWVEQRVQHAPREGAAVVVADEGDDGWTVAGDEWLVSAVKDDDAAIVAGHSKTKKQRQTGERDGALVDFDCVAVVVVVLERVDDRDGDGLGIWQRGGRWLQAVALQQLEQCLLVVAALAKRALIVERTCRQVKLGHKGSERSAGALDKQLLRRPRGQRRTVNPAHSQVQ